MSKITNDGLNPVWHGMICSCTYMATVGVKGLMYGTLVLCAINEYAHHSIHDVTQP